MHLFENQYFKEITTNLKTPDMHDLKSIYTKMRRTLKTVAKDCFDSDGNHRYYPNAPSMSDLEIISLTLAAESLQITSENLLWSKIQKDYPFLFPNLVHRTSYNRRKKALRYIFLVCTERLALPLVNDNDSFIIDSIPVPTCKIIREKFSKACRRPEMDEVLANKGYNAIMGGYFIGYKIHLITTESGVYRDLLVTSANVHDNAFLKEISMDDEHLYRRELLGDRAYIGHSTQLRLFEETGLTVHVPYRRNQKDYQAYNPILKLKRKTIEVVFSQYCDEYAIRQNYAKRFDGFEIRIITKVAAKTFKQYWNYLNNRPINQTKHALAA